MVAGQHRRAGDDEKAREESEDQNVEHALQHHDRSVAQILQKG